MNRQQRRQAARLARKAQSPRDVRGGKVHNHGNDTVHDLEAAVRFQRAGDFERAEVLYHRILDREPDQFDALHLLGLITNQNGQHNAAIELIRRALAINPNSAPALTNLGILLKAQGHLDEAADNYRQAIKLDPNNAEAHYNLGILLKETGQLDEAIAYFRRTTTINPRFAQAHNNLGSALQDQGKLDEAVACFQQALAIDPNCVEAHSSLGNAFKDKGNLDESITCFQRVIAIDPDHVAALNNLGSALQLQGKYDEAMAYFQRALAINPNFPAAHSNLGVALKSAGQLDEAIVCFHRALAIDPRFAQAHNNLGSALQEQGKFDKAFACFQQALAISPNFADAHSNLGNAFRDKGMLDEAIACYQRVIAIEPDRAEAHNNLGSLLKGKGLLDEGMAYFRHALAIKPDYVEAHSNVLFNLNYRAASTPGEILAESLRWDETYAAPLAAHARPHTNDPDPERRLRVGYVSPDFRTHSVNYFFEPLIAAHDRNAVEVFCYAEVVRPDETTARLRELADGWCSTVRMSHSDVAEQIRQDRIDILVDLAGHTAGNRLLAFAERPAPVQAAWLGYGGTTGMTAMDYRLSDAIADPQGDADALHSETLVRLPDGFFCYTPPPDAPEPAPLPSAAKGHITFGSFNNLTKLHPGTIAAWARVLDRVPGSRFMIKSKPLAGEGTRKRYLELFAAEGIGAERLDLVSWVPSWSGHLGAYGQIDIALDTYPYNGCTTTCEALWMGVPVVTLRGDRFVARMGASILTRVGLSDLVAETTEGYVETAVALAGDRDRLTALRRDLHGRMRASPLCDAQGFARNVEAAYRDMWRRWCNAEAGHD